MKHDNTRVPIHLCTISAGSSGGRTKRKVMKVPNFLFLYFNLRFGYTVPFYGWAAKVSLMRIKVLKSVHFVASPLT